MGPSHSLNFHRALVLALLTCLPARSHATSTPHEPEPPDCKAHPGSSDWPSPEAWAGLDDRLGGRLLQPAPPGAVCHPGQPNYDPGECPAVAAAWTTYDFHVASPVSVMWNNFNNDTCLPDPSYSCSPDGYPAYVVNASTPEHVKLGVDFARDHHVRINVKNTGHDYLGRSNAPGSLSIWTHYLKDIEYHEGEFALDACDIVISGDAMTVGGGVEVYDAYLAAAAHNHTIIGGTGKSVGVAGHSSGGGHSILSSVHGLAADSVLQMQLVTPCGDILTVNEAQHSDLFWALRGGGGSTFGVVTSLVVKAIPSPRMTSILVTLPIPIGPTFWDVVAFAFAQFADLGDELGLSGYFFAAPSPVPEVINATGVLGASTLEDDQDGSQSAKLLSRFAEINETLKLRWPNGTALYAREPVHYESFIDWFEESYDQGTAGHSNYLGSRLFGKELLRDERALARALGAATEYTDFVHAYLVAGRGTAEAEPRGGGNAVHPAWRTAYYHTLSGQIFPPNNETAEAEAIEAVEAAWQPFRDLTPGGGSYINEASKYEPGYQQAFWGDNYQRLLAIKKEIDPTDVFWCQPCVGNEGWMETDDGRLCRAKEISYL